MTIEKIFQQLWQDYSSLNPSAQAIHDLFSKKGEEVVNDHIAFRTYNDPRVGIHTLSRIFLEHGYEPRGFYVFEEKHLFARHYEHPKREDLPLVFISELILEKFDNRVQETIRELLDSVPNDTYEDPELIFRGNPWGKLSYKTYQELLAASEYAAWLYVYGFRANHFTVRVNDLSAFHSLEEVNALLKKQGYPLNTSGGEIKGSARQLLEQSSILADKVAIDFQEGTHEVPACYYEFAHRHHDSSGKLFMGFIANSADKIFESTNSRD